MPFGAILIALLIMFLPRGSAFAGIAMTDSVAPACTLTVFEDECYQGCDESLRQHEAGEFLATGFETGKLVSTAGEHAISLMRAWRGKRLDGIFGRTIRGGGGRSVDSEIDWESPGDSPRPFLLREATRLMLQRHFEETDSIDSMAVEIVAESTALAAGELTASLWIARTISDRDQARAKVVSRFDYREWWFNGGVLLGFEEVGARHWQGDDLAAGRIRFPQRAGAAASRARK